MSADPIIYRLQRLTDYRQLERLASDVMIGAGYTNLEPIGGSGDGGRDALHENREDGRLMICAYSARADWETKFHSDCKRIHELEPYPNAIVFVSTREIGSPKRDSLRISTLRNFGWEVEIYDCERLRAEPAGPQSNLDAQLPSIFVPPWFSRDGDEVVWQSIRPGVVRQLAITHGSSTLFASAQIGRQAAAPIRQRYGVPMRLSVSNVFQHCVS